MAEKKVVASPYMFMPQISLFLDRVFYERAVVILECGFITAERVLKLKYLSKGHATQKRRSFKMKCRPDLEITPDSISKMKYLPLQPKWILIAASIRIMQEFFPDSPMIIPINGRFELDGEEIVLEDNDREDFKDASETDPHGMRFPKVKEVLTGLAIWHISSAVILRKATAPPNPDIQFPFVPRGCIVPHLDQLRALENLLNVPKILEVGDFRPQNLQLLYRACGMYDVLFKEMTGFPSSILLDLVYFLIDCPVDDWRDWTGEKDLIHIYHRKISEVCLAYRVPLSCSARELKHSVYFMIELLSAGVGDRVRSVEETSGHSDGEACGYDEDASGFDDYLTK